MFNRNFYDLRIMTRYVFALALILFTSINVWVQKVEYKLEEAKLLAQ